MAPSASSVACSDASVAAMPERSLYAGTTTDRSGVAIGGGVYGVPAVVE